MDAKKTEEILEFILRKTDQGDVRIDGLLERKEPPITLEALREMEHDGLIEMKGGMVSLLKPGRDIATRILRCHRLAERLFDVLDMSHDHREEAACHFEHLIPLEASEAICTLLGHPTECQHGKPIPPGECCKRAQREVQSIVLGLADLRAGERGKIVYMTTKQHQRMDKLTSFGFFPGVEVKVHQTSPAYVVQIGNTDIAMDREVLLNIFVRKIG
ncbi:MAG TPA: metal-dependent transcriptional regulator [bacterium]|nr:metal-dependent transcriptional regulator [bacterium]